MTIPLRLGHRAQYLVPVVECPKFEGGLGLSTAELAFRIFAAFRAHPHINNVLTHISRAKWIEMEQSLNRILDLSTTAVGLSTLEDNIIDLMVGERGITGRIFKPYFQATLRRILEPSRAERLIRHINALYLVLEWKVQHPQPAPPHSEPSQESGHARGTCNERVINVADIGPQYRHAILFRLFEHLSPDDSLQLVVDHDPMRLRLQLEARHGSRCDWSYLKEGPNVWRVRLRLLRARDGDHG